MMAANNNKKVRCAIYTRVSTDAGLDQDFNSLDAQYDAAEAYVRSQAHAGWTLVRTRYDDGSQADRPTGPPCSSSWPTSEPTGSISSSSIRFTA
jgi:hypothetical protein